MTVARAATPQGTHGAPTPPGRSRISPNSLASAAQHERRACRVPVKGSEGRESDAKAPRSEAGQEQARSERAERASTERERDRSTERERERERERSEHTHTHRERESGAQKEWTRRREGQEAIAQRGGSRDAKQEVQGGGSEQGVKGTKQRAAARYKPLLKKGRGTDAPN